MTHTKEPPFEILLSQRFLPEYGGAVRWMYEAYRRWPRPVHVITHDYYGAPTRTPEFPEAPPRPPSGDHAADPNFTIDRRDIFLHSWGLDHPRRIVRYLRMTRAVWQQLKRHGRVQVYCRDVVPEVVGLLPLKKLYGERIRIISYAHGEEITSCESSRQLRMMMRRACRAVDLMIANSHSTTLLLRGHIDPAKIEVVHPGVTIADFEGSEAAGAEWRRRAGIGADDLVLLTVGRLDPRKNQAAVIEAVARLAPRYDKLFYYVVGMGGELASLKARAERLGVGDRVVFTGSVDEATKRALYAGCDLFIMPSIRTGADIEGFGMVFLEAGACGKPCIAGRDGGQAEAVLDNETGLVVDAADPDAVVGALDRLLSDTDLRRRLGRAARCHTRRFDWSDVVERTVRIVDGLDQRKGS